MASKRSPARLVIALSVAVVLAVFLLYNAVAGGTPSLEPRQLGTRSERVRLAGVVLGPVRADAESQARRFRLRDIEGRTSVPVVYRDSVPDLFRPGRSVVLDGRLRNGVFVGVPGTLVTKCPPKYTPKKA